MAPSVKLHFYAANDVNGDLLHEITDEDDYFKSLKLKVERDGLGGAELLLARTVGFSPFATGTFRAESFVRLIVPAYSSTTYYPWGFFLNKRQQVVVHVDEKGGEEFKLGGPGPKQYLARHALGIEQQTGTGANIDLENGVWRWNEHATVGRILDRIIQEDAALNNPSLPDLTYTFDNIDDSDGVNWIDDDIAGPGEFEIPIGTDLLKILWDLDDFVQLTSWVDLGTVASPKFELNIIQGLGDDNTGSAFGAGVCLLKEGVNVADDAVTVEGASLRQASHVLVEGKDGVWVQAVRTGYSPGDYTKREKISFTRTRNEAWLEAVGKRWLDRQDNGEKEITIEIVPGQSDAAGSYFPAPDRVLWLSNLISVETAADGTSQTALDLDPSDAQLVTGFELDTHQAADDANSTALARSWDVKVKLNVERSGNVQKTPDQRSSASGGDHCKCLKLCPTGENILLGLSGASLKSASENASFPRENAVNGDDGTQFSHVASGSVADDYIAADRGESRDVDSYRYLAGSNADDWASSWTLYGSNDAAAWTWLPSGKITTSPTANGWTQIITRSGMVASTDTGLVPFSAVQSYRYWLLRATGGPTTGVADWDIAEWELWENGLAGTDGNAAHCDHQHVASEVIDLDNGNVNQSSFDAGFIGSRFLIGAHGGDIGNNADSGDSYPQGSLEAHRQAALKGADYSDVDCRQSSDGTWWVFHDETLDEETNGTGAIASATDVTLNGLAYDSIANPGYNTSRHGTSIGLATVQEVINAIRPYGMSLLLECKPATDAAARSLAELVVANAFEERAFIHVYFLSQAAAVKAVSPRILVSSEYPLSGATSSSDVDIISIAHASVASLSTVTAFAPRIPMSNMPIVDYGAPEADIIQTMYERGVRMWTSNDLDGALAFGATAAGDIGAVISDPQEGDMLRYDGSTWVNTPGRWEPVTSGVDTFVWSGSNIVMGWNDS